MNDRRYSIKEVQKMTQLSPKVLQAIIKKYRQHLTITTEKGPEGKEQYLDHPSFERLMFIKQLHLREQLSQDEATHQLMAPSPSLTQFANGNIPMESLKTALDGLSKEVSTLGDSLQKILARYHLLVKEVNIYRAENRELQKELEALKAGHHAIVDQIKREELIDPEEDDQAKKGLLN
jgi:chromosome segregation ATPase